MSSLQDRRDSPRRRINRPRSFGVAIVAVTIVGGLAAWIWAISIIIRSGG